MMDAEMASRVGAAKHAKLAGRTANWHGTAPGTVVLGGRRVPVERPRGRTLDGDEIELDTYSTFNDTDLLTKLTMERMLVGIATRRHDAVNEPVGEHLDATASSTSKSAVLRRFKQATEAQLVELMSRDLSTLDICVLLLDGVHCADRCCVIALAITADGIKVPVGLWIGDTENKTIGKALLADLVARGLSADYGLLILIDGGKALAAAVGDVFGDLAVVHGAPHCLGGLFRTEILKESQNQHHAMPRREARDCSCDLIAFHDAQVDQNVGRRRDVRCLVTVSNSFPASL